MSFLVVPVPRLEGAHLAHVYVCIYNMGECGGKVSG